MEDVVIVIDAGVVGSTDRVKLLEILRMTIDRLPRWIRVVVTSRPDEDMHCRYAIEIREAGD